MNILSIGKDCVGCGSCVLKCPFKALVFVQNREGFYLPELKAEQCTNCGLCLKHCPQTQNLKTFDRKLQEQKSYAAFSLLKRYYKRSASGGAFVTLAWRFLHQHSDAVACGATFSDGRVHHIMIDRIDELQRLQGSKYVQSQLDDIYSQIADRLKNGGYVLFSGTPCQVAGLFAYLGNTKPERLLTIDIICHGVPSPSYFDKDMLLYANSAKDIEDVEFRWKHPFFKSKSQFCLSVERHFLRKTVLTLPRANSVPLRYDPYFSLFSKGITLRESCYQCHYANLDRIGDITIGDCDSHADYPDFHPYEATSVVIINTKAGEEEWEGARQLFDHIEIDIQHEADVNHQLKHSFQRPPERDTIYKELETLSIEEIRQKYSKPKNIRYYVGKVICTVFPQQVIKKILNKINHML